MSGRPGRDPRMRCPCCGLWGIQHGDYVNGGAAGSYHAAECGLIVKVLSHRYQGVRGRAALAFADRFDLQPNSAARDFERAIDGMGSERLLDRLRTFVGWLAPYQVPEEHRDALIAHRLDLAARAERYKDVLSTPRPRKVAG